MPLYRAIDVWKRASPTRLVRYRCFEVLPAHQFCVQSADSYHPAAPGLHDAAHSQQFLELLLEEAPESRGTLHATLEEAIQVFDRTFAAESPQIPTDA